MLKKLASVVLGVVLLVSPSASSAQSLAELQAQVLALLAQLNALQAQISAQVSGTPNVVLTNAPTPTVTTSGSTTFIEFKMEVRVTNTGSDDIYIPLSAAPEGTSAGAMYRIIDSNGNQVANTATGVLYRVSGGTETNDHLKISGAASATLGLNVLYSHTAGSDKSYWLRLVGLSWKPSTAGQSTGISLTSEFITPDNYTGTEDPQTIKITSPNGGEVWEIGQLNTITWTPYAYIPSFVNPPKDITVSLQRTDGSIVGRIMDTGKASLHTYFNIDSYEKWAAPGQYYVYVKNNVTGASDRSDAPFTLLPRSVDLKVNGADGGISITDNQSITVSWKTANYVFPSCTLMGVRTSPGGGPASLKVAANGSGTYYAYAPYTGFTSISLECIDGAKGLKHTDSVSMISGSAQTTVSLKVVSPNGGESIDPTKQLNVKAYIAGLKTLSLALYKNDQWLTWLFKDISTEGQPNNSEWWHVHTPISEIYPELKNGSEAIYKIYATGLKADSTGYVDDKSDAPFSFSSSDTGSVSGTVNGGTFATNKPTITGTAVGIGTVGISIDNGDKVYGSGNTISVTRSNTWSHTVTQALADGEYKVDLYSSDNQLLSSARFTVKTTGIPASTKGTYQGFLNGKLFITTKDITEADALANCKKNANNNPTDTIRCLWNDKEIYRRDGVNKDDKETATYRGYMNGQLFIETKNITEAEALTNCKVNDRNNPKDSILCIWKDKEIYRRAAPAAVTPSAEKGTYKGYLNGALFITTENITQADALVSCKKNANSNQEKTIRCTWNGTNIYERAADTSKKPTCTLKANPGSVPSGGSTTLTWVTTYADWVKLDDGKTDYGSVNKDGSRVFTNIKKDTTFTLKVNGKERVDCMKTVKVSNSSSMSEAENIASAAAALEAALQVIMSLIPEEQ